ncbi:MAG TPA: hypothetical protein VG168_07875 [Bryobacteraceae bacterium]|nr:hypothetical protein [Bryobacteraceae bacterium]
MKFAWAMFCLLACLTSVTAQAQNGVSNVRDANGNLVRNNGLNPTRGPSQPPVNNLGRPDNRPAVLGTSKARPDNGAIR